MVSIDDYVYLNNVYYLDNAYYSMQFSMYDNFLQCLHTEDKIATNLLIY